MKKPDPLYTLFEQHLHNALVENESAGELIDRVVREYLNELKRTSSITPAHLDDIADDLREEVLDMFRKKTYGHYNLAEYRAQRSVTPPVGSIAPSAPQTKTPARGRRSS